MNRLRHWFTDPRHAFTAWGVLGLLAAVAVGLAAVGYRQLSPVMTAALAVTAVATFTALAVASALGGRGVRLVYYHQEVAILATTATVTWAAGRSVAAYQDVVVLAIGTFLAFGRVGCLVVGCCHGRPARRGVRYGDRHSGFPAHLAGVTLVPVQAIEAAGVTVVLIAGGVVLATDAPAGAVLAWYVASYGVLRFGLELLRGDAGRPTWLGFSQPQWISVLLCAGAVAAGWVGVLPGTAADGLALAGMVAVMLLLATRRTATSGHRYADPVHTAELAATLAAAAATLAAVPAPSAAVATPGGAQPGAPVVRGTSRGLRVSAGPGHYTLSAAPRRLEIRQARTVAALIGALRHADATLLSGTVPGVYHVLLTAR